MEFLSLSRRRSSARNVPTGEERGETDVFAGYNHSSVQMIETIYRNSSFQFKHINTKDVHDLFENLNPRKSCSYTGLMPNKLMKKVAEGIAPSEIVTGQLYGKRENSLLFTRKGTSIM